MKLILDAIDPSTGRKALAFQCKCGQLAWEDLDHGDTEPKQD